ncbi:MAG: EamA family transporter [Chitinophagaceae bacterium]|nr:EamA family transporter [Chitinophagaceae bacterium]
MSNSIKKEVSPVAIIIAFAILYIVWGSTYFFIQVAVHEIPPFLMGALRFIAAGTLLFLWCVIKKERLFDRKQIKNSAITGFFLLFIGTGAVIWAEKTIPSSLFAVLIASQAIWLVVLDRRNWKANLQSRNTIIGLIIGFAGVILLFSESASKAMNTSSGGTSIVALLVLIVGTISWTAGSIYSKYNSSGSSAVNSTWQMLTAGLIFLIGSFINNEWTAFDWAGVSTNSWLSVLYLVVFGSLAGFSAYVWLLKVRPVTQVGTHVYVNPVVAVLLGVLFAGETMTVIQVVGLAIILSSVLLINLAKYRQAKAEAIHDSAEAAPVTTSRTVKSKPFAEAK